MLSHYEIDSFLQRTPAPLQDIVFELRNLIASVAPDAVEVVRWGDLGYFHAERRGGLVSAGICQIEVRKEHVRLAFIHGAFIPDPRHLLEGKQKAKRSIRIESFESAPWDYFKDLLAASAKFDPYLYK